MTNLGDAFAEAHLDLDPLDRDLDRAYAKLQRAAADWNEIVDIVASIAVDTAAPTAELRRTVAEWEGIAAVTAQVRMDTREATAELLDSQEFWASIARVEVAATVDTTGVAERLAAESEEWDRLVDVRATVDLDTGDAFARAVTLSEVLNSIGDVTVDVDVRLSPGDVVDTSAVAAEIASLDGLTAVVSIDLNTDSLATVQAVAAAVAALDGATADITIGTDGSALDDLADVAGATAILDARSVTVAVVVDNAEALAALADVGGAVVVLDGRRINVSFTIDIPTQAVLADLRASVAEWEAAAAVKAFVAADADGVGPTLTALAAEWDRIVDLTASVHVDSEGALEQVVSLATALDTLTDATVNLDVTLDPGDVAQIEALAAQVSTLDGQVASVAVEVDVLGKDSLGFLVAVRAAAEEVDGITATVEVNVTGDAIDRLADIAGAAVTVGAVTATVTVNADVSDALNGIADVAGAATTVDALTATIDASVTGTAVADLATIAGAAASVSGLAVSIDVAALVEAALADLASVAGAAATLDAQSVDIVVSANLGSTLDDLATIAGAVATLDGSTITTRVEMDTREATAELLDSQELWAAIARVSTSVDLDAADANAAIVALIAEWNSIASISVQVDVDIATALDRVAQVQAALAVISNASATVTINLDPNDLADISAIEAGLVAIDGSTATVSIDLNSADATTRLADVAALVAAVDSTRAAITIDVETASADDLAVLKAALDDLNGETARIRISTNAKSVTSQLAAVEGAAAAIDGRRVTVDVTANINVPAIAEQIRSAVAIWQGTAGDVTVDVGVNTTRVTEDIATTATTAWEDAARVTANVTANTSGVTGDLTRERGVWERIASVLGSVDIATIGATGDILNAAEVWREAAQVHGDVTLDTSNLADRLRVATANLERLAQIKVDVVPPDLSETADRIASAKPGLTELADITAHVHADTSELDNEVGAAAALAQSVVRDIRGSVSLDLAEFQRAISQVLVETEALPDTTVGVDASQIDTAALSLGFLTALASKPILTEIGVDDGDAVTAVDVLVARLHELSRKWTADFGLEAFDALTEIASIQRALDALERTVTSEVDADSSPARAVLDELRVELASFRDAVVKVRVDDDDVNRGFFEVSNQVFQLDRLVATVKATADIDAASERLGVLQTEIAAFRQALVIGVGVDNGEALARIAELQSEVTDVEATIRAVLNLDTFRANEALLRERVDAIERDGVHPSVTLDADGVTTAVQAVRAQLDSIDRVIDISTDVDIAKALALLSELEAFISALDGRNIGITAEVDQDALNVDPTGPIGRITAALTDARTKWIDLTGIDLTADTSGANRVIREAAASWNRILDITARIDADPSQIRTLGAKLQREVATATRLTTQLGLDPSAVIDSVKAITDGTKTADKIVADFRKSLRSAGIDLENLGRINIGTRLRRSLVGLFDGVNTSKFSRLFNDLADEGDANFRRMGRTLREAFTGVRSIASGGRRGLLASLGLGSSEDATKGIAEIGFGVKGLSRLFRSLKSDTRGAIDVAALGRGAAALVASVSRPIARFLGTIGPRIAAVAREIPAVFRGIADAVGPLLSQIASGVKTVLSTIGSALGTLASGLALLALPALFASLASLLTGVLGIAGGLLTIGGAAGFAAAGVLGLGIALDKGLLGSIKETLGQLKTVIGQTVGPIATEFVNRFRGPIMSSLIGLTDAVAPMAAQFFNPLTEAGLRWVNQLSAVLNGNPVFDILGRNLASTIDLFASYLAPFVGVVNQIIGPLFQALNSLLRVILDVGSAFVEPFKAFLSLIVALSGPLTTLFTGLNAALGLVFTALTRIVSSSGFASFIDGIVTMLGYAAAAFSIFVDAVSTGLGDVDLSGFGDIINGIGKALGAIAPILAKVFVDLLSLIAQIGPPIIDAFVRLLPAIQDVIDAVVGAGSEIITAIVDIVTNAALLGAVEVILRAIADVIRFVGDNASWLVPILVALFAAFKAFMLLRSVVQVINGVGQALSTISGIAKGATGALGGVGGAAGNAGAGAAGAAGGFGALGTAIGGIGTAAILAVGAYELMGAAADALTGHIDQTKFSVDALALAVGKGDFSKQAKELADNAVADFQDTLGQGIRSGRNAFLPGVGIGVAEFKTAFGSGSFKDNLTKEFDPGASLRDAINAATKTAKESLQSLPAEVRPEYLKAIREAFSDKGVTLPKTFEKSMLKEAAAIDKGKAAMSGFGSTTSDISAIVDKYQASLDGATSGMAQFGNQAQRTAGQVTGTTKSFKQSLALIDDLQKRLTEGPTFDLSKSLKIEPLSISSFLDTSKDKAKGGITGSFDPEDFFTIDKAKVKADEAADEAQRSAKDLKGALLLAIDDIKTTTRQATAVLNLRDSGMEAFADAVASLPVEAFRQVEAELKAMSPGLKASFNTELQKALDLKNAVDIEGAFRKAVDDLNFKAEQLELVRLLEDAQFGNVAEIVAKITDPAQFDAMRTYLNNQGAAGVKVIDDSLTATKENVENRITAAQSGIADAIRNSLDLSKVLGNLDDRQLGQDIRPGQRNAAREGGELADRQKSAIASAVQSARDSVLSQGAAVGESFAAGIESSQGAVSGAATGVADAASTAIDTAAPGVATSAATAGTGTADAFIDSLTQAITTRKGDIEAAAKVIADAFVAAVGSAGGQTEAGASLGGTFISGMLNSITSGGNANAVAADAAVAGFIIDIAASTLPVASAAGQSIGGAFAANLREAVTENGAFVVTVGLIAGFVVIANSVVPTAVSTGTLIGESFSDNLHDAAVVNGDAVAAEVVAVFVAVAEQSALFAETAGSTIGSVFSGAVVESSRYGIAVADTTATLIGQYATIASVVAPVAAAAGFSIGQAFAITLRDSAVPAALIRAALSLSLIVAFQSVQAQASGAAAAAGEAIGGEFASGVRGAALSPVFALVLAARLASGFLAAASVAIPIASAQGEGIGRAFGAAATSGVVFVEPLFLAALQSFGATAAVTAGAAAAGITAAFIGGLTVGFAAAAVTAATAADPLAAVLAVSFLALTVRAAAGGTAIGTAIGRGIVAGLEMIQPDVEVAVTNMASRVAAIIREALGINSPSKVTMDIGENVSRGLAIGIRSQQAAVDAAAQAIAAAATPATNALPSWPDAPVRSDGQGNITVIAQPVVQAVPATDPEVVAMLRAIRSLLAANGQGGLTFGDVVVPEGGPRGSDARNLARTMRRIRRTGRPVDERSG